ncbi:hypothetical protein [Saccharothrix xinjiangensis]|uniref:Uncharacterized protein n=1 Tax=Saccharothrix xinjiangensis TaxID=204798 RepID=A0ABV9YG63_9PSEU
MADEGIHWTGRPIAPDGGPELSSTDVDATWFRERTGEDPLPSRPLSTTWLRPGAHVPPGKLSEDLVIPTVVDAEAEPAERIAMRSASEPPGGNGPVVGTVTDAPPR